MQRHRSGVRSASVKAGDSKRRSLLFSRLLLAFVASSAVWSTIAEGLITSTRTSTRQEMSRLEQVNRSVNGSIGFMTDQEQYGVPQRFVINPSSGLGDSEDYVLTKQFRLAGMGLPSSRMRITPVNDEKGANHTILVIDNDIVLDNRFSGIRTRAELIQLGYRFPEASPHVGQSLGWLAKLVWLAVIVR